MQIDANHRQGAEELIPVMPEGRWIAWGKLQRSTDGVVLAVHPLLDHMTDVAACFLAIAHCTSVRRALQVAAGPRFRELDEADFERLAVLAFLHDLGKANAGFQSKFWLSINVAPKYWPGPCGHGADAWALLAPSGDVPDAWRVLSGLPLETMAEWGESVQELLRASFSHHGRPVADQLSGGFQVWQPVRDRQRDVYDPAKAVVGMGERLATHFPGAFVGGLSPLPDAPAFVHLFGGLVQLADWLGSDTREGFFPYSRAGENRSCTAPERAARAVRAVGLDVRPLRALVSNHVPSFAHAFKVPAPRPMQAAMADKALGPVVVLEAETGSGKTEAALWRFLNLFQSGDVDGLYFALPTRVAASQIYERVSDFVERVWPNEAPVVVRALPGYEAADRETKTALPNYKVLWSDRPDDVVAERRWAAESPKRFLAATIAVGTIDQALLGALMVSHAHLRQALLARSLLVVDEVHASDAYMTVLLDRLLQAHVACGGKALLLSATLGAAARTRYLNVGLKDRGPSAPALNAAAGLPYPAISSRPLGGARLDGVAGNPSDKTVHWQTLDAIDDPARIASIAVEAAARGARVLVIRNTVPAATATLRAVESLTLERGGRWLFKVGGASTLHHSRFSRQDRPLLDLEIQKQIGKHRADHSGRIVIGTQTLEQSLDIDADLLVTDLCPMDVLLQRLGRLHRHQRPSPEHPGDRRAGGFEVPRAWVLTPAGHDLAPLLKRARHGLGPLRSNGAGLQGVYIDLRILEATRRLVDLRPTRTIPVENRTLVEHAIHGEALDAITSELGDEWQRFSSEIEGSVGARAGLGHLHALPFGEAYLTLQFPDDEQKIATRLGAADRLVHLDPGLPGPFGQTVHQLTLRHHQLPRGLPPDVSPLDIEILPDNAGFEFSLGSTRFRYSRFGLERLMNDAAAPA